MMGERQVDQAALFYEFSLERHVPADHLLRSIDRFVDLGGLRSQLAPFYSPMGRLSIDPELLIRMLFFHAGILAQTPQEVNPWRPYLLCMGEPIAVLALRRKRDQISGTIAHYERLLREAEHDLAHINASFRLFEATGEAADLPPYVDLNRVLRRGETTKICMEALAKEGPLDTRQLALRVIRSKGLSESDKVLAQTVALRVVQTLRMRARRGKVENVTRTKGVCVWQIPESNLFLARV